jgi:hypothetical protein
LKRWRTFVTLSEHLRAGLLGGAPRDLAADLHWKLLVEASSYHFVTPALAWCLRDRIGMPGEIAGFFEAALTLNGRRNARLTEALGRIVAALNVIGIEPVLLKGAARLVEGIYPAQGLRFLGDLDLLIPADRSAAAADALRAIGFEEDPDIISNAEHHHLPLLRERDSGACVELHTALAVPSHDAIIPSDWFWQGTRAVTWRDLRVRLPDATRSVAHNIVHDQLNHQNYRAGRIELRQLLDLAMLRARHEAMIDWLELDRRFCGAGQGPLLATYLEFASALFGQPAPPGLSHAPRPRALADFRRDVEWPAIRILSRLRIPLDYVLMRRGDPAGIVKRLFVRQTWAAALELVRTAFARAKW